MSSRISITVSLLRLAIAALLTAVATAKADFRQDWEDLSPTELLHHLVEGKPKRHIPSLKGAFAFNGCVDMLVDGRCLTDMIYERMSKYIDEDFNEIEDYDRAAISGWYDLLSVFKHHYKTGSAAERVLKDPDFMKEIIELIDTANMEAGGTSFLSERAELPGDPENNICPVELRPGGNAVLMASNFAANCRPNCDTDYYGAISHELQSLIPHNINVPLGSYDYNEMHLIVEYSEKDPIQGVHAPRSNRFILTGDRQNKNVSVLLDMYKHIGESPSNMPHFVVLAGFHMLEQVSLPNRRDHLRNAASGLLKHQMFHDERGPAVHLELASIASPELLSEIVQYIITPVDNYASRPKSYQKPSWSQDDKVLDRPYGMIHSIGCNEQELAALYESMGGTYMNGDVPVMRPDEKWIEALKANSNESVEANPFLDMIKSFAFVDSRDQLTSAIPDIGAVASAIRFIMWRTVRLSRFHFHSYSYHIVAQRETMIPERFRVWNWKDASRSVAAGSAEATRKACQLGKNSVWSDTDLDIVAPRTFDIGDPLLQLGSTNGSSPGVHGMAEIEGASFSKKHNVDIGTAKWTWPDLANALAQVYRSSRHVYHNKTIEFAYAPVVLCKQPRATVGIGDAISSAGLSAHIKSVIVPDHFDTLKDTSTADNKEERERALGRFSDEYAEKQRLKVEKEKAEERERKRKQQEREEEEARQKELEEEEALQREQERLADVLPLGFRSEKDADDLAPESPWEVLFHMQMFAVHTATREEQEAEEAQNACAEEKAAVGEDHESVMEYKHIMTSAEDDEPDEEQEEDGDTDEDEAGTGVEETENEGDAEYDEEGEPDQEQEGSDSFQKEMNELEDADLFLVGGHRTTVPGTRKQSTSRDEQHAEDQSNRKPMVFREEDYPEHLQFPPPVEEMDLSHLDDLVDEDKESEIADLRMMRLETIREIEIRRKYYRREHGSDEEITDEEAAEIFIPEYDYDENDDIEDGEDPYLEPPENEEDDETETSGAPESDEANIDEGEGNVDNGEETQWHEDELTEAEEMDWGDSAEDIKDDNETHEHDGGDESEYVEVNEYGNPATH
eukprot:gb/GECG01001736.1/.p1 GENE.gb/GECG01001736.1/~~gb/GECG01001736.1/.p1  ORF type:complete len:1077 (+),score=212.74 gb/GECG01001736.1/:1-3231(+)